jgi:hypothetical protein
MDLRSKLENQYKLNKNVKNELDVLRKSMNKNELDFNQVKMN